jgi:hypothetical protein
LNYYPAQAARLWKLAVDRTGLRPDFRSNREHNNSAVISSWSNNSECGKSKCTARLPESCGLTADSFFPET